MNKLILILCLAIASVAEAQDTLHLVNGMVIPAAIKSRTPYEIGFVRTVEKNGKAGTASRKFSATQVAEIVHADGTRDSVLPTLSNGTQPGLRYLDTEGFYKLGANDARLFYRGYKDAAVGTFLATFPGSPLLGLIVAIPTSVVKPKSKWLSYPNLAMLDNEAYKEGYAKKAHQIKVAKVWTNWGIGTALTMFTYLIFSSLQR